MTCPRNVVLQGDCLEVMRSLPADSVDSIVTDPPYELGFMGKGWDSAGVSFSPATWVEALRVLKPGGHLLAFGGSRTYHRIAVAIEDAGFEIRDSLMWIYGSGFPKSHDVSKAIDKTAGAKRQRLGRNPNSREQSNKTNTLYQSGTVGKTDYLTAPATDEAKRWEGWGTALKPAHEPIVLARKPLVGTVAENVLAHGTGALNIDASRIGNEVRTYDLTMTSGNFETTGGNKNVKSGTATVTGRWPANVLFDEEAAALLDEQSGERPGGNYPAQRGAGRATAFGAGRPTAGGPRKMDDSGGASRFFYVAKAGKKERAAGVGANAHPTVKPIKLMRYLVRLVTPPGGVVLDPFLGSGTTACAAVLEGFDYIGIEREAEYVDIARARVEHWGKQTEDEE